MYGTFVQRLIGLPGETIAERQRGVVLVNGKPLKGPMHAAKPIPPLGSGASPREGTS